MKFLSAIIWFFHRKPDFIIQPFDMPVMERWYLIPRNRWFNIYLHRLDGADPQHVHDHPWANISIMLKGERLEWMPTNPLTRWEVVQWAHPHAGQYSEYMRKYKAQRYQALFGAARKPGSIVFRRATDAHRLETVGGPSYSLFITGPIVRVWGFWLPTGWVTFKDHVEVIDGVSKQKA